MKKESGDASTSKKLAAARKQPSEKKSGMKSKIGSKSRASKKRKTASPKKLSEKSLTTTDKTIETRSEKLSVPAGDEVKPVETFLASRSDVTETPDIKSKDTENIAYEPKQKPVSKPAFNYAAPEQMKGSDSMKKTLPYLIVGFIVLIGFLLVYSLPNANKFYIKKAGDGIRILQGTFSPLGNKVLVDLPGMQAPDPINDEYSKDEAYAVICHYYLKQAENVWAVPGTPDIDVYKAFVAKARAFASTDALSKAVTAYSNDIDLMTLLYRADLYASKGTLSDAEKAVEFLNKAADYQLNERQTRLVEYKIKSLNDYILLLKLSD